MSDPSKQVPHADLTGTRVETRAVRAGQRRTPELEHSEALYPTSSFVYNSAAQAAARFAGDEPGNIYSRFTNPTVATFEDRIAAMEGGERGVGTASGMSAILATFMGLLQQGDHIVCSRGVFGTTTVLLQKYMARFGVETTFVDLTSQAEWEAAICPETRMLFLETPSNPLGEIADLEALAALAHRNEALLVVDNCLCTPVLQQPFRHGADIVIHSATKYLDGQGRCVGGAVVGSNQLMEEVHGVIRSGGPTMSPFNAWVFLKGLETLSLRMKAHSENALRVAQWLREKPGIETVLYAGLPDHPQNELAQRQQSGGSGVVSFRVQGGREQAWKLIDRLNLFSITANLGDAKSTVTHPATTTHGRLSDEDKARGGITENLVRLSIGLESVEDLIEDLDRALAGG
ncbi:MAG: O-succinylhomoserine sulfhydrylase [Pseudomonadota bacterium]